MSDPTTPENTTGQPLTPANIKTINQLPHLDDIDPDDVILVQDVSQNTYRKSSLQAVVERMNPLLSVNLTQAEYDALTESEKLNGTYYNITDDSPPPYQLYFDATMPIGIVYEQLPPTLDEDGTERTPLDPNALFNNGYVHSVWKKLDYNGAFFRADGGNALPFGTGVQDEELPNIKGDFALESGVGVVGDNNSYHGVFGLGRTTSYIVGYRTGVNGRFTTFSASDGQSNADGTYLSAEESAYKDGGHVAPRNLTIIKWIRVS